MAHPSAEFASPQVLAPPGSPAVGAMVPAAPAPGTMGGYVPRGPEILVGGFNQTWLMHCLRRRWLLATMMGLLVGGAVALLLMWLFPESSRITSYLEVRVKDEASPFEDEKRPISSVELEREAAMHPALIKSPMVLEAALIREDIAELDAVQYHKGEEVLWLLDELRVTFATDSPILEILYEGDESPEDMVKIVNAIVDSYKQNVLYQDRTAKRATRQDVATVLNGIRRDLKQKMDDLVAKYKVNDSANFEDFEYPKLLKDIALYQQELVELDGDLAEIEVLRQVALAQANSPAAMDAAVAEALDSDPTIAAYKEQLFVLDQQIQQLASAGRNPNNASLRRAQSAVVQTQQAMQQYRMAAEREIREKLAKLPNEALRAAIVEYQVRAQYLIEKKKEFEEKLAEAERKIKEGAVGDPETEMLEAEIEAQQELVQALDQKLLEWQTVDRAGEIRPGQEGDYEKVQVVQEAIATEQINYYERWAIAGIGGLAAMALTCYGVALLEFRRRRLNGPNDVDEGLGIRVLGVLPPTSLKALGGHSLTASQVAEGIDNVRATVMYDSTSRPRQVVMVTSPRSKEGATTVAGSLAMSLARAGRRTLLIDGDLRAPSLHKLFGLPLEDGLSEVLRSEIDLSDAVQPTSTEGLHMLTAGVCDMDAIHALATDQPQAVFDKLRDQFDFVVIDAPPVLGVADSLSLGQYIDGAILTVLRDHSGIRDIHSAVEVLRSMGVRVIGSVVNGVPMTADPRVVRLHKSGGSRQPRLPAKAPEA